MQEGEWVIVAAGTPTERVVPIRGRLFVGRECGGVDPERRLLIDNPAISRDHLEIRAQSVLGPRLIDLSTNGTRLNGRRVERGEGVELQDGDRIELGGVELLFRSMRDSGVPSEVQTTVRMMGISRLAVVVGDIVGYTAMTEAHGGASVAEATDALFGALRDVLARFRGTVSNFAGDAMFAAWDAGRDQQAASNAVGFALSAADAVATQAPTIPLRAVTGEPVRMGWAVTLGDTAAGHPLPGVEAIHGDAVNLAFRLSGAAARGGRPTVLVSADAASAAPEAARYSPVGELEIKGRSAPALVHGATRA